jgi:hypothetical protein
MDQDLYQVLDAFVSYIRSLRAARVAVPANVVARAMDAERIMEEYMNRDSNMGGL